MALALTLVTFTAVLDGELGLTGLTSALGEAPGAEPSEAAEVRRSLRPWRPKSSLPFEALEARVARMFASIFSMRSLPWAKTR